MHSISRMIKVIYIFVNLYDMLTKMKTYIRNIKMALFLASEFILSLSSQVLFILYLNTWIMT